MAKPVILLGAGASIDGGLPDAFGLTKVVYDALRKGDPNSARLFGFVISKLLVRNARGGGSPFDRINIEEAYDALKRMLYRDEDVLGEFVSSWEPLVPAARRHPSAFNIKRNLQRGVAIKTDLNSRPTVVIDQDHLRKGLEELLGLSADGEINPSVVLRTYVDVLAEILTPVNATYEYLAEFLKSTRGELECIGSLNYDLLIESAAESQNISVDYGLSRWNEKRVVQFQPGTQRILKLHGSVNWFTKGRDEVVLEQADPEWRYLPRAMIFGGQHEKLNPDGPFLSLRHEFQRALERTTVLAVVGYSFSDDHLNAMLRSWLAVKRKGKFIVLDPDGFEKAEDLVRGLAGWRRLQPISANVEFQEIRGEFAKNVAPLVASLKATPKPRVSKGKT